MAGSIGTTSTGGVFIGGTTSGINTTALIEAAVAQKTRRADLLDVEIGENTAKIGAYDDLSALTSALEASLDRLRGANSLIDDVERVWDQKAGTVLTSDGSDFSSILDISIDSDAAAGSYDIEVLQSAQAERIGSRSIVDDTAALGYVGTFDIGLSGLGTASISVNAGDSLQDLRDAINIESATTGIAASILKVSETEFQLILTGSETAQSIVSTYTGGDNVLNLLGLEKQTFGATLSDRAPGTTFGSIEAIIDNQDTQSRITFTTPATIPTSVPGQVLFESGGGGQGIGLYLNNNNELTFYAGSGSATPTVISAEALQPNTQYSVVVELDDTGNEIRMFYEESSNFDWFYSGRPPEASRDNFTQSNFSGSDNAGVGTRGGGTFGGFNGSASGVTDFQGSIDSNWVISEMPPASSTGIFQPGQEAIIEFDGVRVTRDDNNLDDVLEGVELNLKNAAPGTIISLEVGNDVQGAKDAILGFIDSYNAFRDFVIQNQQVDSGGNVGESAVLFGDNLLNGLTNEYSEQIGASFNDGGVIETIRDLGITITNGNKLVLSDEAKLDSELLTNFDDVRKAFSAGVEAGNNEFRLSRNNGLTPTQDIVFDLTTDGAGTITGVTANGDGSAFTILGNSIVGADGTAFEGLSFTYVGTEASVTINAEFNQGLSERLINGGNGYTDPVTGLIIQEKGNLQAQNEEKTDDARDIRTRAEEFRTSQIERYAKLEADISRLNVLLDQIRAILGTNDDDR
jgi:flagellar capping protein FliD